MFGTALTLRWAVHDSGGGFLIDVRYGTASKSMLSLIRSRFCPVLTVLITLLTG